MVSLCVSWKGYVHSLSKGLGQLNWFYDDVNPKKKTLKIDKKICKRMYVYIVLGFLPQEDETK